MTPDHDVLDEMERTGGSFVRALADAWRRADPANSAKLMAAFPEYYSIYRDRVEQRKQQETARLHGLSGGDGR